MCIDWNTLGTWVGSLGTVGALFFAFLQINNERKIRRETEERRMETEKRQQAEKISAWLDGNFNNDNEVYYILNQSLEPVYQVVITVIKVQGAGLSFDGKEISEKYGSKFRQFLSILPPGEFKINNRKLDYAMNMRFGLEVAFTDARGYNWLRKGDGSLVEIEPNPLSYYNISLPVDWKTPIRL